MLDQPWHIRLLGRLMVSREDQAIRRFRSRTTGLLLGYLAFYSKRSHPREELVELIWPESRPDAGRTNLRVALKSLRSQLEPPGVSAGSALLIDRMNVQINPAFVMTDVAAFEAALRSAASHAGPAERARHLSAAVDLYGGELLPGYYEEWVLAERPRLADAYLGALRQLTAALEQEGDVVRAIDCARRYGFWIASSAWPRRAPSWCAPCWSGFRH